MLKATRLIDLIDGEAANEELLTTEDKPNNLNSEAGVGKIRLQNASLGNVSVLSQKELQKVDVIGRALRIRGE